LSNAPFETKQVENGYSALFRGSEGKGGEEEEWRPIIVTQRRVLGHGSLVATLHKANDIGKRPIP